LHRVGRVREDPDPVGPWHAAGLEAVRSGAEAAEDLDNQAADDESQADDLLAGAVVYVPDAADSERGAVQFDGGQPNLDAGRGPVLCLITSRSAAVRIVSSVRPTVNFAACAEGRVSRPSYVAFCGYPP